jgi:hypothetical protein
MDTFVIPTAPTADQRARTKAQWIRWLRHRLARTVRFLEFVHPSHPKELVRLSLHVASLSDPLKAYGEPDSQHGIVYTLTPACYGRGALNFAGWRVVAAAHRGALDLMETLHVATKHRAVAALFDGLDSPWRQAERALVTLALTDLANVTRLAPYMIVPGLVLNERTLEARPATEEDIDTGTLWAEDQLLMRAADLPFADY